jgi:hypothetical protein
MHGSENIKLKAALLYLKQKDFKHKNYDFRCTTLALRVSSIPTFRRTLQIPFSIILWYCKYVNTVNTAGVMIDSTKDEIQTATVCPRSHDVKSGEILGNMTVR